MPSGHRCNARSPCSASSWARSSSACSCSDGPTICGRTTPPPGSCSSASILVIYAVLLVRVQRLARYPRPSRFLTGSGRRRRRPIGGGPMSPIGAIVLCSFVLVGGGVVGDVRVGGNHVLGSTTRWPTSAGDRSEATANADVGERATVCGRPRRRSGTGERVGPLDVVVGRDAAPGRAHQSTSTSAFSCSPRWRRSSFPACCSVCCSSPASCRSRGSCRPASRYSRRSSRRCSSTPTRSPAPTRCGSICATSWARSSTWSRCSSPATPATRVPSTRRHGPETACCSASSGGACARCRPRGGASSRPSSLVAEEYGIVELEQVAATATLSAQEGRTGRPQPRREVLDSARHARRRRGGLRPHPQRQGHPAARRHGPAVHGAHHLPRPQSQLTPDHRPDHHDRPLCPPSDSLLAPSRRSGTPCTARSAPPLPTAP